MTSSALEIESCPFALSIQELLETIRTKDPLQSLRAQARKQFEEVRLPHRKSEPFQYFPLTALYENTVAIPCASSIIEEDLIDRHMLAECRGRCIVFVDGSFSAELSVLDQLDPKVTVCSLEDAMRPFGHFLNARLSKQIKEEKDPFALLNFGIHTKGAFLYVPPKVVVEQPLQVLHVITQEGAVLAPRLQVFVGLHAKIKLYSSTCACDVKQGLILDMIDVNLEEGAELEHLSTALHRTSDWSMEFVRATLKANSSLRLRQISKNTSGYRRDIKVDLLGQGAFAEVQGMSLLFDKQQTHTRILVNHLAPHTESKQHYKGVLSGYSQSSFEGKIFVDRVAQKTQAYQLCNHLLLGQRAIANSKPNLEIFADDVKASHGATMAQLKEDELFYLKSRGIGQEQAKNLLIEAFCEQMVSSVFLPSLREELKTSIKNYAKT